MIRERAKQLLDMPRPQKDLCRECNGARVKHYGNTATYRSGPGVLAGQAITTDVCDQCWGSGTDEALPAPADALPQNDVCRGCNGARVKNYSNTATYRSRPGIVAGRAITQDVCDVCWGSGTTKPRPAPADSLPQARK